MLLKTRCFIFYNRCSKWCPSCSAHIRIRLLTLSWTLAAKFESLMRWNAFVILSLISSRVVGYCSRTICLTVPHRKKSGDVKSGDLAGQFTGPPLPIQLSSNCCCSSSLASCWNHISVVNKFIIMCFFTICDQEEYPLIILLNYSSKNVYTWVRLSVLKKKTDRSLDPRALRPTHLDSKCFGSSSAASNEDLQPPNNAYCDGLPGHYF